ncbi:MAG TPA: xanthine dehydrogenase family protein molybdopterin-binding subunit [Ktedonobacteraceae bacterium]
MKPLTHAIGAPLDRIEGREKVTGSALYAYEHQLKNVAYAFPVQSTIARGRVISIDTSRAQTIPGVLAVLSAANAPRLGPVDDADLAVLQSTEIAYYGQFVAAVIAESLEIARYAAECLVISYEEWPHDVDLQTDRKDLYKPARVNGDYETDTESGDVEAALASAPFSIDCVYTTPAEHNNPLETHATIAAWHDNEVTMYDATQGAGWTQDIIVKAFKLPHEHVHIIAPHVGGAFGCKAFAHPHTILAVMAAQVTRRPVKLALTRQMMFAVAGYRTPTIQHIRMGAAKDGRLTAIAHDVITQTARIQEFAEQAAVQTRTMYAAPNRRTTHRLARLDVPVPAWMRAPGEAPGMFALESAMDEMALACGLDPIEFRIRNEPEIDPETGLPYSSRNLVACLREGARRFGWDRRNPRPRAHLEGRWLVGSGVAASTYPVFQTPDPTHARVHVDHEGNYTVRIDAADIGTGARTALTQIAADAFEVPVECVCVEIGNTNLPPATGAGGSRGTASWGTAIVDAANKLHACLADEHNGLIPPAGIEVTGELGENPEAQRFSMHSFGAQFAEVRVNADTGEVRVPYLLGVFAAGRIINPKTARSQFLGGMTMGLSMALDEESYMDQRFGDYVNHDFASYHIASDPDIGTIDIAWIDEHDPHVNPLGVKGIGEIGIVGTAAAIANAVYHATGIRVRDLPITLDKLLG